jgi:ADP-heptose:LPS heptosyltransferase
MRVLIEFMPALGDFVTQLPILHALHEKIEPLDVEVVVERTGAALLADYDWVGRRHLNVKDWSARRTLYLSSYRKPFDLLLYLRANPTIKFTRLLARAKKKLGAEHYDDEIREQGAVPHCYSILRHIFSDGLPEISTRIVLKSETIREAMAAAGFDTGARILCIGPGSSGAWKQWPVERFAELALVIRDGYDGIAVLGSPAESGLCAELAHRTGGVNLSGLPLTSVAALLAESTLYLGNDSGPSHLAAAQECPAVSIGLETPEYYTPWNGYALPGLARDLSVSDVLSYLEAQELID